MDLEFLVLWFVSSAFALVLLSCLNCCPLVVRHVGSTTTWLSSDCADTTDYMPNHTLHTILLHIYVLHLFMAFIVPLQTREALSEEVAKQQLNIIDSVSFPTDQNPQPFVLKLQVGSGE